MSAEFRVIKLFIVITTSIVTVRKLEYTSSVRSLDSVVGMQGLFCVPGAHPAFSTVVTGALAPGESGWGVALATLPPPPRDQRRG
jgi:hypothetical protein